MNGEQAAKAAGFACAYSHYTMKMLCAQPCDCIQCCALKSGRRVIEVTDQIRGRKDWWVTTDPTLTAQDLLNL
jgi:hypothetical protein